MQRSKYRFVFFDVDSTLVTIEGIDVLAGGNEEIARLTEAAMNGDVPIDEVYGRRLAIIRPDRAAIEALGRLYVQSQVDGAKETVAELRAAGCDVHLVSGGIRQAIEPLAAALSLPSRAIHAVSLDFDAGGAYAGFDTRSFLTRSGGKELVVRDVLARSKGDSAFIGDGVTDLEAAAAVDLFVGFGGVHIRQRVRENAAVYITEPTLRAVLPYLLEQGESAGTAGARRS